MYRKECTSGESGVCVGGWETQSDKVSVAGWGSGGRVTVSGGDSGGRVTVSLGGDSGGRVTVSLGGDSGGRVTVSLGGERLMVLLGGTVEGD